MNAKGHEFTIPGDFSEQDILFLSISGSHAYGTSRPDSDVDVRGVWIPTMEQVVSITPGSLTKTYTFNHYTDYVDIELKSLPNYLRLLGKGNCNCLENLFQEKIWSTHPVQSLQKLTMEKGIHKGFVHSFKGFSISQQRDFHVKRKTKCLLYVFRLLAEGIYLFETGKLEMDINKLYRYMDLPLLDEIINNYNSEQSIMGTGIIDRIDKEVDFLRVWMDRAKDEADIPDEPDYQIYNDWYYDFYMSGNNV
jgi:predicted nucleotidyltransferase